jgi:hypothetical protein
MLGKNVIIASNNPLITKEIEDTFNCTAETQWLTVAKHISETISMDLVVLMNTYCNTKNKNQYFIRSLVHDLYKSNTVIKA